MSKKANKLVKEYTEILSKFDSFDVIPLNDPDMKKMEEIMKEIKKLEEDEK